MKNKVVKSFCLCMSACLLLNVIPMQNIQAKNKKDTIQVEEKLLIREGFDIQVVYDQNSKKTELSWSILEGDVESEVYSSDLDGKFNKITSTTSNSIDYSKLSKKEVVDIYIAVTDGEGNKTVSPIIAVKYDEEYHQFFNVEHDSDQDGISDGYEIRDLQTDVNSIDTDGDGLTDFDEVIILHTDPLKYDEVSDSDSDGITDHQECENKTNPRLKDTDFDGITDTEDENSTENLGKPIIAEELSLSLGKYDVVQENDDGSKIICNIITGHILYSLESDGTENYFFYTGEKQLAKVTEKSNEESIILYQYTQDKLTCINNNGAVYKMQYNESNQLISVESNDVCLVKYNYVSEDNDKVQQIISENGEVVVEYSYSENGQLEKVEKSNGSFIEYKYDGGILSQCFDSATEVTYTYEYDEDGELIRTVGTDGSIISQANGECVEQSIEYEVGSEKQEVSIVNDPGLENIDIEYTDGMEVKCTSNNGVQKEVIKEKNEVVRQAESNIKTRETSVQYHGGDKYKYVYNKLDKLETVYYNDKEILNYEYDEYDRIKREDNSLADQTIVYNYTEDSNIKNKITYPYSKEKMMDSKNIIMESNNTTKKYDGEYSLEWDSENHLIEVNGNEFETKYKYNALGQRIEKIVNGVSTKYYYVGDRLVYEETNQETIEYNYNAEAQIVGFSLNNQTYYYEQDGYGTVLGIYDDLGVECVKYSFDSYGTLLHAEGDEKLIENNSILYRGYYYDQESQLYYIASNQSYYNENTGELVGVTPMAFLKDVTTNSGAISNVMDLTFEMGVVEPTLRASSSGKYNTLYSWDAASMINYNCYAFAMGKTNVWYYPGIVTSEYGAWNNASISETYLRVMKDIAALGYVAIRANATYVPYNYKYETLICVRRSDKMGDYNTPDFHFMKKTKTNGWLHKPGQTAVLKFNTTPGAMYWYRESYANGRWNTNSGQYYNSYIYYIRYSKTRWIQYSNGWKYYSTSGVAQTGWKSIGGFWYYFDSSGIMKKDWQLINGKWYYLNSDGVMQKGWIIARGTWYYLNESGDMRIGWLKYKNEWYYLKSDGGMASSESLKIGNKVYNFSQSGICTNP